MVVQAYILIQTEVGKAAQVAKEVRDIGGVAEAEDVTGPYDVIVRAEAKSHRAGVAESRPTRRSSAAICRAARHRNVHDRKPFAACQSVHRPGTRRPVASVRSGVE